MKTHRLLCDGSAILAEPMTELLSRAATAYESGDSDGALQLTRQHLRHCKDDVRGWEMVGLIQFSRGRFRVSVSALERASLIAPLRPAARVCLAHGYGRLGRAELSLDLLVALIPDESLPLPLLLQVASGLDAVDHPHLAMHACREAARRDPAHAQAYYDQGYYAARCGLPANVTESLARKAISLAPDRVCFRVGLAGLLVKQDRHHEALVLVKNFTKAQVDEICCACCLKKVVQLYQQAGDYRRAVLCHQRIIALELHTGPSECE